MSARERLQQAQNKLESCFTEAMASVSPEAIAQYEALNKVIKTLKEEVALEEKQASVVVPVKAELTESKKWAVKFLEAVTTGSNFNGGMPQEMAAEVTRKMQNVAQLRQYCRVYQASSDYAITVESGLPTVSYVTEGGTIGTTSPASAPVILNAYKLACIVPVSNEAAKDTKCDIMGWLTDSIAEAFAAKLDSEILFGSGSSAITGIEATSGIAKKTSATTLVITWAEVKAALSAIGAYRQNATFVMGQDVANQIMEFKDSNNTYIFPQNQELKSIMGHPVVISDAMPTVASGKAMLIVGDFRYYGIAEREGFNVQVLNELYAGADEVGIKAVTRLDGKVLQAGAFCEVVSK